MSDRTFVHLESFPVTGILARTSNAREATSDGAIGKIWARFIREGLAEKIPHRVSSDPMAFYSNYASDEHGEYDFLLGARVTAVSIPLPDGMVVRNTPASRFAVFEADTGPPPKVVPELWRKIWAEPRTPEYARSYRGDFELYRAGAPAKIYIAVTA
ncbi:MAG: effector binding domain-containing protein [Acidobacteriota bacterium]|nr:effector binding domain-containing protein [Acidobacteriota bacterium]